MFGCMQIFVCSLLEAFQDAGLVEHLCWDTMQLCAESFVENQNGLSFAR
jgi:hypothetical protein